ncbi:MAG TPA: peptidase inhibitor I78 [Caulobacteraceae bacterium]|jgi:hypothetical protein
MRTSGLLLLLLVAGACAPYPVHAPPPAQPGPWYGHHHGPRPHPYPPSPPRYTYASPDPSDACGAREYRWLVGRDRSEIPPQRPNQAWRVYSTTMGVTADHSATRLNILWDARTERVLQVSCG